MGVERTIDITAGQRKTILALLKRHLPATEAWVYGSRAKWTSRPQSDLDLVVFATPEQRHGVGNLREALEESDLPFRVDLFVWDEVPETFREQIEAEHAVLAAAPTPRTSANSGMVDEWVESTLGEVAEFLTGGTPAKSCADYWDGSIPWVSAKDMKRFRIEDTEDHVTEVGVENGTKLVPEGTALLLTRGMTLINDVPICVAQRPVTFNQDVKALRPKPCVAPEFLPYLLLGNKQRLLSLVDLAGHGTGRLNSDELKALDIVLPACPEQQRAIARILETLDDKIELNRHMNETLEAMARALFKDWFVDFGPVRAKAEGRDPGLPQSFANLFPARLVHSELGEIPEGWEAGTVAGLSDLNPEVWTKKTRPAEIRYVDLSNTKRGRIEAIAPYTAVRAPSWAQRVLRPGDTIVGTVRPGNGAYALVSELGLTSSTGFAILRPKAVEYAEFVYLAATSAGRIDYLAHLADGAAYPAIRPDVVAATPIARPGDKVLTRFSSAAGALLGKIANGEKESRTLAALRDLLLPKLISGEIRPFDTEKVMEAVT